MIRTIVNESFDVGSVMDILYGERSGGNVGQFICGADGKKVIREGEVIRDPEKPRDYTTFWRKKPENTKGN